MWGQLAVLAITYLVSYFTAPKPPSPKPATMRDFDIPTAEEGREIPVVFGTVRLTGPNVAWYGDLRTVRVRQTENGQKYTAGYLYYMGLHMGLCHGPVDELQRIEVSDRTVWSGSQSGNGSIYINKPKLFGGYEKEGGIQGTLDVMMGSDAQGANSYLTNRISGTQPGYRGVTSVVWRQGLITSTPYIKPWAFTVKRLASSAWQPDYAEPTPGDANPAHVLREVLTNPEWGMGCPLGDIDDTDFAAAAQTLHGEGFGLSMAWTGRERIEALIQRIADHIGAAIRVAPDTGKWQIKLIRNDYDPVAIPQLDTSNAQLVNRQLPGPGEMVNNLQVLYTDPDTHKTTSVTAQSLAGVAEQGAIISESVQYPGIRSAAIAQRVAERDLIAKSTPLSRITIRTDRRAWQLLPGDVFRLNWPPLGIVNQVFRVGRTNYGTTIKAGITIEAVEDVFGLPATTYTAQPSIGWVDPSNDPAPCPRQGSMEMPYWFPKTELALADFQARPSTISGMMAWGSKPTSDSTVLDLITRLVADPYAPVADAEFSPWADLASSIPQAIDDLVLDWSTAADYQDMDLASVGDIAVIGSELLLVKAIDVPNTTITMARAVLDTVPTSHAAGSTLWILGEFAARDFTAYEDGTTVDLKLLPSTTLGQLDEANATLMQVAASRREDRPYPPANFQVDWQSYPEAFSGTPTLTWVHRDRTQQDTVVDQDYTYIGPEAGVTYQVAIYGESDNLLRTVTGIVGATYTYSQADELTDTGLGRYSRKLRFVVHADRGGLLSHQAHDFTVDRGGYGLNYGLHYGIGE